MGRQAGWQASRGGHNAKSVLCPSLSVVIYLVRHSHGRFLKNLPIIGHNEGLIGKIGLIRRHLKISA
jgi:hypothetical protein